VLPAMDLPSWKVVPVADLPTLADWSGKAGLLLMLSCVPSFTT
jgi:hypothetical protein